MAAGYNLIAPSAFSLHSAIYSIIVCVADLDTARRLKKNFGPNQNQTNFNSPSALILISSTELHEIETIRSLANAA